MYLVVCGVCYLVLFGCSVFGDVVCVCIVDWCVVGVVVIIEVVDVVDVVVMIVMFDWIDGMML